MAKSLAHDHIGSEMTLLPLETFLEPIFHRLSLCALHRPALHRRVASPVNHLVSRPARVCLISNGRKAMNWKIEGNPIALQYHLISTSKDIDIMIHAQAYPQKSLHQQRLQRVKTIARELNWSEQERQLRGMLLASIVRLVDQQGHQA